MQWQKIDKAARRGCHPLASGAHVKTLGESDEAQDAVLCSSACGFGDSKWSWFKNPQKGGELTTAIKELNFGREFLAQDVQTMKEICEGSYLDVELRKYVESTNVTPLQELTTKLQWRHAS